MENENVNVNEQYPAAPVVEVGQAADAVTSPNSSATTPPINSAVLESLSDEERDLFESTKELSDIQLGTLPPNLRKQIFDLREKAKGSVAPENVPENTAAAAEQTPPATDTANPEPAAAAPKEQHTPDASEVIRRLMEANKALTEDNRKLNARYDTLQGKYNAEIKNAKKPETEVPENNPAAHPAATDTVKTSTVAEMTDEDIAKFAEDEEIDPEVAQSFAKFARRFMNGGNNNNQQGGIDADTAEKVKELYHAKQNDLFDAAIRQECGAEVGLNEVGTHPLFQSFARELYDSEGITAWDAIMDARNKHQHSYAAGIIKQVVDKMQSQGMWDLSRHMAKSAVAVPAAASASTSAVPSTQQPGNESPGTDVKPSAVTPHSASGVSAKPLHTGRTLEDVKQKYDALEKRFKRGDASVVAEMMNLSKEFGRLAAAQMQKTT